MTRIALIGDLHGNMPAVEALDKDLSARGIDTVWCLGDVVGKGPSSDRVYDWAVERCSVLIMGNWDEGIGYRQFAPDAFYWEQLGERRMEGLRNFSREYITLISGRKLRLIHGRPIMRSAVQVYADAENFYPLFSPDIDVLAYADVHRQGQRLLNGGKILLNCGSVGNGMSVAMVQYAILTGEWGSERVSPLDITLVTLPYDRQRAVRDTEEAEKKGLQHGDAFRREILTGVYSR